MPAEPDEQSDFRHDLAEAHGDRLYRPGETNSEATCTNERRSFGELAAEAFPCSSEREQSWQTTPGQDSAEGLSRPELRSG
jgi:hypothetical protein